jgi:uncharacterized repeat protein (TIGR03803 family)
MRVRAAAPRESVLYTFRGGKDGADPVAAVIFDKNGNIYGTTKSGGEDTACTGGCGTVYKLSASGGEQVLYRFKGGKDGSAPEGALVGDAEGDLFGTTYSGGSTNCQGGCGTVFELVPNPSGTAYREKIVHEFTSDPDGAGPTGTLTTDGTSLFGTTMGGGSNQYPCGGYEGGNTCGTVFMLKPQGSGYHESIAYTFQAPPDASRPNPNLILGKGGIIYGSAWGGSNGCSPPNSDCGTVFGISKSGSGYVESFLFTLISGTTGAGPYPVGGVIQDSSGAFYGMQALSNNYPFQPTGAVFKLTPGTGGSYSESFLWTFTGVPDGSSPQASLIMDHAGNLYGTTLGGGSSTCSCGTVFELSPGGPPYSETILYSFLRGSDGMYPASALVEDKQGALYGTTTEGGSDVNCSAGCGTVFKITR